jgi:micrococcal nuclease
LAVLFLLACTAACTGHPPTTRSADGGSPPPAIATSVRAPAGAQSARVRSIVDGDTLHLVASGAGPLEAGRDERVRLLEINAPEIHGKVQCYGPEATTALGRLTPVGSTVRVVADKDGHDRYGRPLLYVWSADGTFVNEALVREGDAVPLLIAPNDRFIDVIRAAERGAKSERRGQWETCH